MPEGGLNKGIMMEGVMMMKLCRNKLMFPNAFYTFVFVIKLMIKKIIGFFSISMKFLLASDCLFASDYLFASGYLSASDWNDAGHFFQ